ncbi:MAG: hypothetical protein GXP18_02310 [Gammaproteobacteria bacterium]|nr:hypothetical protein [Gammaproteobacteria bacterium]
MNDLLMLRAGGNFHYDIDMNNTGIFDLYTDYFLTSFSSGNAKSFPRNN